MAEDKLKDNQAAKPPVPPRPRLVIPAGQEPVYSNVARISHSPSELILDFARLLPGETDVMVKTRILMSPLSAKLLQRALADNLAKYEAMFGEIKIPQGKSLADDLFRNFHAPEPPPTPPAPPLESA